MNKFYNNSRVVIKPTHFFVSVVFLLLLNSCSGPEKVSTLGLETETRVFDGETEQYSFGELEAVLIGDVFRFFEFENFLEKKFNDAQSKLYKTQASKLLKFDVNARDFYDSVVSKNLGSSEETVASLERFIEKSYGSSFNVVARAVLSRMRAHSTENVQVVKTTDASISTSVPDTSIGTSQSSEDVKSEFIAALETLEQSEDFDSFFEKIVRFSNNPNIHDLDVVKKNIVFQTVLKAISSPSPSASTLLSDLAEDKTLPGRMRVLIHYSLSYISENPGVYVSIDSKEKLLAHLESYLLGFKGSALKLNTIKLHICRKMAEVARQYLALGNRSKFAEVSKNLRSRFDEIAGSEPVDLPTGFNDNRAEYLILLSIERGVVSGLLTQAVELLLEAYNDNKLSSVIRTRMGWMIGFYRMLQNQPGEALSLWQSESFQKEQGSDSPRLMYWQGRAYQELGDLVHANFYFTGAVSSSSSYYSLLSFNRMIPNARTRSWFEVRDKLKKMLLKKDLDKEKGAGWEFFWDPDRFQNFEIKGSESATALITMAFECVRLKRKDMLLDLYESSSDQSFTGSLPQDQKALFAVIMSRILYASGLYSAAMSSLERFGVSSEEVFDRFPDQYIVYYPYTQYFTEIKGRTADLNVDPSLVMALGKEISGFEPRLVTAGAKIGVLQLTPEDSHTYGASLGKNPMQGSDLVEFLKDPRENLSLGIRKISALKVKQTGVGEANLMVSYLFGFDFRNSAAEEKKEVENDFYIEFMEEFLVAETLRKITVSQSIYKDFFIEAAPQGQNLDQEGVDL